MIKDKYLEILSKFDSYNRDYYIKIDTENKAPIYIGVSSKKKPTFLFDVPTEFESCAISLRDTVGYKVTTDSADANKSRYKIEAANDYSIEVFFVVVDDLINIASKQKDLYFMAITSRLLMWEEFFKHSSNGTLTMEEEIGLFGELSFIEDELQNHNFNIIDNWCGPLKKTKDFICNSNAIEIKTSINTDTNRILISDENQLDSSGFCSLLLNVRFLTQNQMDGKLLPELVDSILYLIDDKPQLIQTFKEKLLHAGYKEEFYQNYKRRFELADVFWFKVEDLDNVSFPRIIPSELKRGVKFVKYQIELSSLSDFSINTSEVRSILF